MKYLNLGQTGLRVSQICLGMMSYGDPNWRDWILSIDEGRPFVARAAEAGINFYDTADMYSHGVSEEVTGQLLREIYDDRQDYVVATKVFFPWKDKPNRGGLSRKHILWSVDQSLKRLNTDYIDLYQIHRFDYGTPMEETMRALHDVVQSGKVRYIGASSMWAWQFAKMQQIARDKGWTPFIAMQNHYNLIYREEEREMNPLCRDQGVGLIPWSPLARGFLAGNRTRANWGETTRSKSDSMAQEFYYTDADFEIVERARAIGQRLGASPAQVALAWLMRQPGVVSPIIGATKMKHLDEAIQAAELELSEDDLQSLAALYQPKPVYGHR